MHCTCVCSSATLQIAGVLLGLFLHGSSSVANAFVDDHLFLLRHIQKHNFTLAFPLFVVGAGVVVCVCVCVCVLSFSPFL